MQLIDFLVSNGFTVLESQSPLSYSLNQLDFPVAILTVDFVKVTENSLLSSYRLTTLYPHQSVLNLHKSINLAQAIQSTFNSEVLVSSITLQDPDCSGGVLTFILKEPSHNCGYVHNQVQQR